MAGDGGGLWRECARWLVDIGVLRPDHKIVQPSGTMVEFATLLRDGVLLCRLINELVPNALDDAAIPQQVQNVHISEFQCQKTVCLFLGACQRELRLSEEQLFSAWELVRIAEFGKVLNALSLISHLDVSIRKGVQPFPVTSSESCSSPSTAQFMKSQPEEEEDIYRHLQDDVDNAEVDSSIYDIGPYRTTKYDEPDKIYDHIVARQDSKRESRDAWSTFHPQTKRDHCIKELLDTEKNYVEKALSMIINKFYSPLESYFREKDVLQTVFMNIVELWNLHTSFHNDLRQAVLRTLGLSNDDRPTSLGTIGDVFLLHKERFIAYGPYCTGLDCSRAKLLEMEKSDAVARGKIVDCCNSADNNQFKLQDLLCLPMQRVLKYHILLSEMIKATPVDASDRHSLEQAKEAMEDINAYVNEMKRDHETKQLIVDVERSLTDCEMPRQLTLLDYGRLHKDGEVKVAESSDPNSIGKLKQRHVFLFDKVLIICHCQNKRNSSFSFKGAHAMSDLTLDLEMHSENKFGTISKKLGAGQHMLHFVRDSREEKMAGIVVDPIRLVTLAFKNRPILEKWLESYELAKDNVHPKSSGHRLHYQTYDTSTAHKCTICDKFLKGLLFQGYKCDGCGGDFHKSCVGRRPCPGRRQPSVSGNASFTAHDLNHRMMRTSLKSFSSGEQVVAIKSVYPKEPNYLTFNKDDVIEVIELVHDGVFKGCLSNNRTRTGLVYCNQVRRIRSNSMVNLGGIHTPIDVRAGGRIDRKESTTVLPKRPLNSMAQNQPEYMNTEVNNQPWYMGDMERAEAERKLRSLPNGTFLVRYSNNRGRYALSISYEGEVKHTIVEQTEGGKYFLDEGFIFNSIVELINYYKTHNMNESFNTLNTCLRSAFNECRIYRVIHDFEQEEAKFLKIQKGDIIMLIDTIGEDRGWWKGSIGDRIGFFPMSFVEAVKEQQA